MRATRSVYRTTGPAFAQVDRFASRYEQPGSVAEALEPKIDEW